MWVMIILVTAYMGRNPALTTAEFASEQACVRAGQAAREAMGARFVCVPKGGE